MKHGEQRVTYTFVNSNSVNDTRKTLKKIIIEKLLSIHTGKELSPD